MLSVVRYGWLGTEVVRKYLSESDEIEAKIEGSKAVFYFQVDAFQILFGGHVLLLRTYQTTYYYSLATLLS